MGDGNILLSADTAVVPSATMRNYDTDHEIKRINAIKRIEDVVLGSLLIIAFSWLMLAIACATKLTSPGPVFFVQERRGQNGLIFRCFKFRTMFNEPDTCLAQTSRNDTRVTRIGKMLRKASLDELPQLCNVILGDMSLIGPRPMPIGIRVEGRSLSTVDNWNLRYAMKPGLTGLAQINGSRGALLTIDDARERLRYDLMYMKDWSLLRDLMIILRTARLCIHDRNAC